MRCISTIKHYFNNITNQGDGRKYIYVNVVTRNDINILIYILRIRMIWQIMEEI